MACLVENDVFAKMSRMFVDSYKCLKNVEIDCHPHCQILENAFKMLRTLTNAITNNCERFANSLQMKRLCSKCLLNCRIVSFVTYWQAL